MTTLRRIHAFFFLVLSVFPLLMMLLKEPVRAYEWQNFCTHLLLDHKTSCSAAGRTEDFARCGGGEAPGALRGAPGARGPAAPAAAPRSALEGSAPGLFSALLEPCAVSSALGAHCFCSLRWTNCSLHRTRLFSSSSNHYYLFPVPLEKMDFWHPARLHYWIPLPVSGWNHDKGRRFYWKGKKNCRKNVEENLTVGKKASCVIVKKCGSVSHPAHEHFIWWS